MPTREKRSVILHPAIVRDLLEAEPSVDAAAAAAATGEATDGYALTAEEQDLVRRRCGFVDETKTAEDMLEALLLPLIDSDGSDESRVAMDRLSEHQRVLLKERRRVREILQKFKKDEERRIRDQRIKDNERLAAIADSDEGVGEADRNLLCQYVADYDESDREELVSGARVEFGKSPLDWAVATVLDVDHADTVGGIKWAWQEHQRQWEKFYDTETEKEIFAAIIKDMPWYKRPFYRQFMPTSQVAEYHKIQVRYGRAKENQPKVIKKIAKLLTEENFPILYERCQEQVRALNVRNLAALAKSSPVILEILLSDVVVQRKLAKAGLWTEVYQDFWNNFKGQSISEECPLARAVLRLQQRIDEIKFSDRVREMKGRATICLRNQGSNFVYGLDRDGSESDLFVIRVNPNYARKFIMGQLDDMDEFISGLNNFRAMYKKCRPQIQRLNTTDLATLAKTHWEVLDLLLRNPVIVKKLRRANLLTGIYETVSAKAKVSGITPANIKNDYPYAAAVLKIQSAINEVKLWDCVKNVSSRKSIYLRNLAQKLGDASYEELLVIQYNKDYYETLIGYIEKYKIGCDEGAVTVYSAAKEFEKILDQKRQDRIEEALPAARVEEGESVATPAAAAASAADAATQIQSHHRGHVERSAFQGLRSSAIAMQALVRGKKARRQVTELKARRETAATTLQSYWKGKKARAELAEIKQQRESAATEIQRHYRVHKERNAFLSLQKAATAMQALVRGKQARRDFVGLKAAAIALQKHYRGHQARGEYKAIKDAAITVQKRVRGEQARQEFERQKTAATTLQSHWRGRRARQGFVRFKAAAIALQKHYRGHQARGEYEALKDAAIEVQRRVRGEQTRTRLKEKQRRESAATTLQRAYRERSIAKVMRAMKSAAERMQAFKIETDHLIREYQERERQVAAKTPPLGVDDLAAGADLVLTPRSGAIVPRRAAGAVVSVGAGAGAGAAELTEGSGAIVVYDVFRDLMDRIVTGRVDFAERVRRRCTAVVDVLVRQKVYNPGFERKLDCKTAESLVSIARSLATLYERRDDFSHDDARHEFAKLSESFNELLEFLSIEVERISDFAPFDVRVFQFEDQWGEMVAKLTSLPKLWQGQLGKRGKPLSPKVRSKVMEIFRFILGLDVVIHRPELIGEHAFEGTTYFRILTAPELSATPKKPTAPREVDGDEVDPLRRGRVYDSGEEVDPLAGDGGAAGSGDDGDASVLFPDSDDDGEEVDPFASRGAGDAVDVSGDSDIIDPLASPA